MDVLFKKIYYDPEEGYSGVRNLYLKAKAKDPNVTLNKTKEWLSNQDIHQRFTRKKPAFSPIIAHSDHDFQCDLMFMNENIVVNKNFSVIMNFVNVKTRFAYCYALKNKFVSSTVAALKDLFSKTDIINITMDGGSEFEGEFKALLIEKKVNIYIAQPGDKNRMAIVERFHRTLRSKLLKYSKNHDNVWITGFQKLVKNYNNSVHRSINAKPSDVDAGELTPKQEDKIQDQRKKALDELSKFKVGDNVRISKQRSEFSKEGVNFSKKLYTVARIDGFQIFVKNSNGDELGRSYKTYNLLKVNEPSSATSKVRNIDLLKIDEQVRKKQQREFGKSVGHEIKKINDDGSIEFNKSVI